ncbi:uncharacterized protein [Equus przewalskii]|uniref:Uncharacterized protein n=1 Tax=Equus przewalskii TaxID=9798 RepID=A0ABM4MWX7_EQUPR
MEVGKPVPPRNRSSRRRGEERDPQAHPWGRRTRRAEIHAASVTHPSLATGASRRAPRGRGAGRSSPGRPRAARRGVPEMPRLGVEVIKLLIPRRGSKRASGRLGRSFERVYLRTLQAERARNSRISSEAANICRREKEAEPGRAVKDRNEAGTCGAGGGEGTERQQRPEIGARPRGPCEPGLEEEKSLPIPARSIFLGCDRSIKMV